MPGARFAGLPVLVDQLDDDDDDDVRSALGRVSGLVWVTELGDASGGP